MWTVYYVGFISGLFRYYLLHETDLGTVLRNSVFIICSVFGIVWGIVPFTGAFGLVTFLVFLCSESVEVWCG